MAFSQTVKRSYSGQFSILIINSAKIDLFKKLQRSLSDDPDFQMNLLKN